MAKSNSKRKTRSDKFSFTLHKTGRYCKKIKGKPKASTCATFADGKHIKAYEGMGGTKICRIEAIRTSIEIR